MNIRTLTLILAVVVMNASMSSAVTIDLVPVGDPGNVADTTGYGAVSYNYQMGKYDVTNAQYAEFLTAKASSSDPYGLWISDMSSSPEGGINRSGTGPYTYTVKPGQGNQPVIGVTWFDTLRFANWLNNGRGNSDTESGSYTLLGGTPTPSNAATITRNVGAKWILPSEDEWYKAAYYKGGNTNAGYWTYPTKSNTPPTWVLSTAAGPNGGTNSANFYYGASGFAVTGSPIFNSSQNYLTDVGSYPESLSAYGTLDQGGDVWQWNEALIENSGYTYRGFRGGSWLGYGYYTFFPSWLASSNRNYNDPTFGSNDRGFRVACVPEPGSLILLGISAISLLAYAWRRRNFTDYFRNSLLSLIGCLRQQAWH